MKKYLQTNKYCNTPYPRHVKELIQYVANKESEMMYPHKIIPIPTNMVKHIPTKNYTGIFSFINYSVNKILP